MTMKPTPHWLFSLLLAVTFGATPSLSHAQLAAGFDADGLASLRVADAERLSEASPRLWRGQTADGNKLAMRVKQSTFDPQTRTLQQTYAWGNLQVVYQPAPDHLRLEVTVTNQTDQAITELAGIRLLRLHGLGETPELGGSTYGLDGPHLVLGSGTQGSVVWYSPQSDQPLRLDLRATGDGGQIINCRASLGGNKVLLDNLTAQRDIPAGGSDTFAVSLKLSGPGTDAYDLAAPLLDAYREAHPRRLNWPDRRPILRLFFGGGLNKEQSIENLRHPEAAELPDPDPRFREHVIKRMHSMVKAAELVDAQGVIIWDMEGDTFPHATSYIGDPRLTRLLNPQMDMVIDDAMQIAKDAGLHVGVTLRPSRVIYNQEKKTATHSHTVAADPFEELDAKVAYAKQRWGCRLIYIDTNYFWRPYGPNQKWQSARIPPHVWRRLLEKHPDVLLIPEFGSIADYPYTAPYAEADMGGYGVPELAKRLWPEAFRIIVLEDADPFENFDRFVASVRAGNALMTYAYSSGTRYVQGMAAIQAQARMAELDPPDELVNGDTEARIAALEAPEETQRYFAAKLLAADPTAEAGPALLARAVDPQEAWVVRRAALLALARIDYPPAADPLMALVEDRELGVYAAAAEALAAQGDAALDVIFDRLNVLVLADAPDTRPLNHLQRLMPRLDAKQAWPRLQSLFDRILPTHEHAEVRSVLLRYMGALGATEAEPILTQAFTDPLLRNAATSALADVASPSAIRFLEDALAEARRSDDQAATRRLQNALHEAQRNAKR